MLKKALGPVPRNLPGNQENNLSVFCQLLVVLRRALHRFTLICLTKSSFAQASITSLGQEQMLRERFLQNATRCPIDHMAMAHYSRSTIIFQCIVNNVSSSSVMSASRKYSRRGNQINRVVPGRVHTRASKPWAHQSSKPISRISCAHIISKRPRSLEARHYPKLLKRIG